MNRIVPWQRRVPKQLKKSIKLLLRAPRRELNPHGDLCHEFLPGDGQMANARKEHEETQQDLEESLDVLHCVFVLYV